MDQEALLNVARKLILYLRGRKQGVSREHQKLLPVTVAEELWKLLRSEQHVDAAALRMLEKEIVIGYTVPMGVCLGGSVSASPWILQTHVETPKKEREAGVIGGGECRLVDTLNESKCMSVYLSYLCTCIEQILVGVKNLQKHLKGCGGLQKMMTRLHWIQTNSEGVSHDFLVCTCSCIYLFIYLQIIAIYGYGDSSLLMPFISRWMSSA